MESLLPKLKEFLPNYSSSTLHNLLLLTLCLLQAGTVNLYKLRGHVSKCTGKPTKAASGYKRLLRLFDGHAHSRLWLDLLIYGFRLLRLKSDYLVLDGTSWERYGVKRHYLTLSIVYQSVAVPIYWSDLAKLGISSTNERQRMFRRVLKLFNLKGKILLADREYVGKTWFKYLTDSGLGFVIRLRYKNYKNLVDLAPGKSYQQMVDKVLRSKFSNKAVGKRIEIDGQEYTFVVVSNNNPTSKDKVLFLLSSLSGNAPSIAARYQRRWGIESCFRHLKSNGFHLEQINLKGKARAKLLMAVMVFTYVLSIHEGLKTYKRVRVIKHANGSQSKAESVFRHGYDNLIAKLGSLLKFYQYLAREIKLASSAYCSAKWLIV